MSTVQVSDDEFNSVLKPTDLSSLILGGMVRSLPK